MEPVLYHAAYKGDVESILKNGLLTRPPVHNWEGMYTDGQIFFAFSPECAVDYVLFSERAEENEWSEDDIVLFQINPGDLDQSKFHYDWNVRCEHLWEVNSVAYSRDVPPELLKIASIKESPEFVLDDFKGLCMYDIIYDTFDEEVESNMDRE